MTRPPRPAVELRPAGGVSIRYIETSALLAARVEHDAEAASAVRGEGRRVMSALTGAEAARRFVRSGAMGQMTAQQVRTALAWLRRFEGRCHVIPVTPAILARLRRRYAVEPVRTLDAIHLATIESLDEDPLNVAVVTRDRRIADNANAMGYLVE